MPGMRTSMPNFVWPVTLSGVSRRLIDLPMSVNCDGVFSVTDAGGASFDAASATWPKVTVELFAEFEITPFETRQRDLSMFHLCAAAWTSISRACAPAVRSGVQPLRML